MSELECHWPDYDTTFTFSVKYKGETLWDDGGKMPQSLRLLLSSAVNTLVPDSTVAETVLDFASEDMEIKRRGL